MKRFHEVLVSSKLFRMVIFVVGFFTLAAASVSAQSSADVVMVLPFENKPEPNDSYRPEYNWVGETFADALTHLLNKPGLQTVSGNEREVAYLKLKLPQTIIPSRATAIKLARAARANVLVIGTYSIQPPQRNNLKLNDTGEKNESAGDVFVRGSVRVIKVDEGRNVGMRLDGNWLTQQFDFGGPLTTLQNIHGDLAYQILRKKFDMTLPFSRNTLIGEATKIPQRAFEAYVKGIQLVETDPKRANYLKNAIRFYSEAQGGAIYPEAAFELGRFHMLGKNWTEAVDYFTKIQKTDQHYAEAAFYAGLGYAKMGELGRALAELVPLASDVRLIGIYNNAGAVAVQASLAEKKDEERDRLLAQGTSFLARAAESSPDDSMVLFNYGLALLLGGKYAEAIEQLKPVIIANPRDGQAYFLYAKALEKTGNAEMANAADDQARRFLPDYAKWQTEWQKSSRLSGVTSRLREFFNRDDLANLIREKATATNSTQPSESDEVMAKARGLYQEGRDDEALEQLRRAVTLDPTSAESYLLSGRIHQRMGDQEAAIATLKTAIFWDPKLIDAYILLGRIFLERGDRAEATKYAASAMTIDPNNQEAMALQRQVTMGKN